MSAGGVNKGRVLGVGTKKALLAITGTSSGSVSSRPPPFLTPEAQGMIDDAHRAAEDAKRDAADAKKGLANAEKTIADLQNKYQLMEEFMNTFLAERNNPNPSRRGS